jgi:hypothetical protein
MTIATKNNQSSESTVILKQSTTNNGSKSYTLVALDKKKAAKMGQARELSAVCKSMSNADIIQFAK